MFCIFVEYYVSDLDESKIKLLDGQMHKINQLYEKQ